ncbi:DUF748 domain-containing protein [Thalassotalea profundi]|uniref:DUF748 domain-containing protein n=1 Tax=Thalassotalea profundi TaxID=2036687 RepID=UPI001674AB50|nr:DUF748 domain-containing protein [Thalassotalea profundi]
MRYNPFLSKLSVENFVITKNKNIVIAIKELELGISLYQLLFDRIYIKQFDLDGLFIKVRQDKNREEIAGFSITNDPDTQAGESTSAEPFNYEIILPLLKLQNAKVGYESDGKKLEFIATYFNTKNIAIDNQKQSGQFQLSGKLQEAIINLSGKFDLIAQQGVVENEIDLMALDLSLFSPWLPETNQLKSGLVTLSGQQKIHLIDNQTKLGLKNSQVKIEQLEFVHDNILLSIDQQEFYAKELELNLNEASEVELSGQGQFSLNRLALTNHQNKQQLLASVRSISLPVINIDQTQTSPLIALPSIDINKIIISDELNTDLPPLLHIDQTQLIDVNISDRKTAIDSVSVGGLSIDTYISDTKNIDNLNPVQAFINNDEIIEVNKNPDDSALTQANSDVQKNNKPTSTSNENQYRFVLNQLNFSTPARIKLVDASIKPNYKRNYTIDTLKVGPVDTHQPNQETRLTVAGYGDEHEKFNVTSVNKLFAEKPSYSVKGYINEIDLSSISPYIKDALKHEIKSGQFNLDIDTEINDGNLSGNADILIRHIEFSTKIADAHNAVNTTASMPLNIALDMLKDSSGNVELSFPLAGDVNSPEFGLISLTTFLVKKASMMAAKDYLMQTFVPYANVVSIAMTAADAILKVRFNDLSYIAKQVEPSVEDNAYLSQFAQLLIDKPDTHVTICPIAVPDDINLKSGAKVTEPEQIEQLNKISMQRFNHFKSLMNQQYNIETSRLISCSPSIDSSIKAKPRLSFST